jgi:ATF/CREB family transcription factor
MEFQKTALSAARKSTHPQPPLIPPQTELKTEDNLNHPHPNSSLNDQSKTRQPSDPFHADPAHNAANGLYLLAQMGAPANSYQASHMPSGIPPNATNNMDSSPSLAKRAAMNNATSAANRAASNSAASNGVRGMSEVSNHRSESSEEPENAAGRKGRNARGKAAATATGKRKNDGSSDGGKTATNKKSKNARATSDDGEIEDYDEDDGQDGNKKDGKKMTDEEKRKNFLERNRYVPFLCARCKDDHD